MQYAKGLDPTLAIYAAYAYDNLQRRKIIQEMSSYMRNDLGARFFDIAALAGELRDAGGTYVAGSDPQVMSPFPMLAQGWGYLSALSISLPKSLSDLRSALTPSLWTSFDEAGVKVLQSALDKGEIR